MITAGVQVQDQITFRIQADITNGVHGHGTTHGHGAAVIGRCNVRRAVDSREDDIPCGADFACADAATAFRQIDASALRLCAQSRRLALIVGPDRTLNQADYRCLFARYGAAGTSGIIDRSAGRQDRIAQYLLQRCVLLVCQITAAVRLLILTFVGAVHIDGLRPLFAVEADQDRRDDRCVLMPGLLHQHCLIRRADVVAGFQTDLAPMDILLQVDIGAFLVRGYTSFIAACQQRADFVDDADVAALTVHRADNGIAVGKRNDSGFRLRRLHLTVDGEIDVAGIADIELAALVRLSDQHVQVLGLCIQQRAAQLPAEAIRFNRQFAGIGQQGLGGFQRSLCCRNS